MPHEADREPAQADQQHAGRLRDRLCQNDERAELVGHGNADRRAVKHAPEQGIAVEVCGIEHLVVVADAEKVIKIDGDMCCRAPLKDRQVGTVGFVFVRMEKRHGRGGDGITSVPGKIVLHCHVRQRAGLGDVATVEVIVGRREVVAVARAESELDVGVIEDVYDGMRGWCWGYLLRLLHPAARRCVRCWGRT